MAVNGDSKAAEVAASDFMKPSPSATAQALTVPQSNSHGVWLAQSRRYIHLFSTLYGHHLIASKSARRQTTFSTVTSQRGATADAMSCYLQSWKLLKLRPSELCETSGDGALREATVH